MNEHHHRPRLSICEVLYSYEIGGSERLGQRLALSLSKAGHEVTTCATRYDYGVISQELVSAGIPCLALNRDFRPRISRVWDIWTLYRWFTKHRVDLLHVHHAPMLRDVWIAARLAKVKAMVLTEHASQPIREDLGYRCATKSMSRISDAVVAINSDVQESILEIDGLSDLGVEIIRNGVDTVEFRNDPERRSDATSACLSIVWVGRLHPVKDVCTAIRAMAVAVYEFNVDLKLDIVGDGEEMGDATKLILELGIGDRVRLVGEQSDLPRFLNQADVYLMSSLAEGTPLSVLEAMSCGLPVISTRVGGIPGLVGPDNGLLVESKDYRNMAVAIRQLAQDPDLRRRMGDVSRHIVESQFSFKQTIKNYEALFSRVTQF